MNKKKPKPVWREVKRPTKARVTLLLVPLLVSLAVTGYFAYAMATLPAPGLYSYRYYDEFCAELAARGGAGAGGPTGSRYNVLTFAQYDAQKDSLRESGKVNVVLVHDSMGAVGFQLAEIEERYGFRSTFYVRLTAWGGYEEYFQRLRTLQTRGWDVGYLTDDLSRTSPRWVNGSEDKWAVAWDAFAWRLDKLRLDGFNVTSVAPHFDVDNPDVDNLQLLEHFGTDISLPVRSWADPTYRTPFPPYDQSVDYFSVLRSASPGDVLLLDFPSDWWYEMPVPAILETRPVLTVLVFASAVPVVASAVFSVWRFRRR